MARRIVDREGEVADALKEFEGWHRQICEIISSVDATNRTNASLAHRDAGKARAATPSCTISPDGDDQQKRDASLASAADAPLPQNA
jgi:hypothetical protein